MARKYLTPIDMGGLEIRNARMHVLTSDPGSPLAGQTWYNSTSNTPRWYNGTVVKDFTDAATLNGQAAAFYLSRANHTGTQLASTISDFATAVGGSTVGGDLSGTVSNAQIAAGAIVNADINAAAAIALSKLATDPLARANHTGTQLASTISDFATAVAAVSIGGDLTGTVSNAQIAAGAIVNADINATAAIALSKLATDPLARANHTGTQLASTISNFDTQVRTSRLDQMAAPTAAVSLNSQKITNLADPTNAQDAATKNYVDSLSQGISVKDPVRAATTANIATLAGGAPNVVDGVTLAANDRVLVKSQTTGSQNGIYVVTTLGTGANGTWTRATDFDTSAKAEPGSFVWVNEGTANGDQSWVLTTNAPITLNTTSLTFTQFGAGTAYTAGNGITLTGAQFSVAAGTGLTQDSGGLSLTVPVIGANGGTGQTTTTTGDLLIGAAGNSWSKLADVATGNALISGGVGTAPSWGKIGLTTHVSGTLPIANGGTGGTTAATARAALGANTKVTATIGNGVATSIAVNHALGTQDVQVQVRDATTNEVVEPDITMTDGNNVTIGFAAAPASNSYKVVVQG